LINVEALDEQGNYRNFLNLQTTVVSPKGEKQTVRLEQTGPGHYEARFPTKEVGAYLLNLMDMKEGQVRGSQVVGASVNYSPEFTSSEPNYNLLRRITETGGGKFLELSNPALNTFEHDRRKTFQPRDLWEYLLELAILLFIVDVGVRRIQIDRDEMLRAMRAVQRRVFFWQGIPRAPESEESLAALLARREAVRSAQTAPAEPKADLFRPAKPVTEPLPGIEPAEAPPVQAPSGPAQPTKEPAEPGATTTSRLLEAKRRAQKRKP
jgi:hypothetical protein